MPRRFFITFILLFLTFFSFIFVPQIQAIEFTLPGADRFDNALKKSELNSKLEEFCDRRSGDQMNLETWYSGKCKDSSGELTDSFSGEGVGFSSIVLLDLAEKVAGKKDSDKGFVDVLKEIIDVVGELVSQGESEQEILAYVNSKKPELFSLNNSGLVGDISGTMAFLLTNPPASTKSYFDYVAQNLSGHRIIPQTYAQEAGVGFSTFAPFLPLWRATRNLAYIVFVLFFIVYGFMMMFRVNIQAKTVITVQLAIPKLIFTLLIITFSYAIVGLLMDVMYIIFYAFLGILASQNLINLSNPLLAGASGQAGSLLSAVVNTFTAGFVAAPVGLLNFLIGGPSILTTVGAAIGLFTGIGLIIGLIVMIAVLISYARLTWKLLLAFLEVIIALITAPIVLLGNALPGSDTFGNWIRGVFANMAVFPITMILLTVSYVLMVQPVTNLCNQIYDQDRTITNLSLVGAFTSNNLCETLTGVKNLNPGGYVPYIPFVSPPLTLIVQSLGGEWGNAPDALLALFGLALLLMASKYVDIVKEALKVPAFKYGAAIGEALKYGAGKAGGIPPERLPTLPGRLGVWQGQGIRSSQQVAREQAGGKTQLPEGYYIGRTGGTPPTTSTP